MKKVISIGAGPSQVPYISLLKNWGYKVIATDRNPYAPGFALADAFVVASTYDAEGTLRELQPYLGGGPVKAVISRTTGEPLRTENYVASKLGLPSLAMEQVERLLHKGHLRAGLNSVAVRPLRYAVLTGGVDPTQIAEDVGYPLVVKPATGGMGGRGVTRVDELAGLMPAVQTACRESLNSDVLLEQFVEGEEVNITGLLYNGELKFFVTGHSLFEPDMPSLPVGEVIGPDVLPASVEADIRQAVLNSCSVFGLLTTPLNIDVILDSDRIPHIIEIEFALADVLQLAPISCNYDLQANELRVDMGLEPEMQGLLEYSAALHYFVHPAPHATRICGADEVCSLSGIVKLVLDELVRVTYHRSKGNVYVWGHVLMQGKTVQDVKSLSHRVNQILRFYYPHYR